MDENLVDIEGGVRKFFKERLGDVYCESGIGRITLALYESPRYSLEEDLETFFSIYLSANPDAVIRYQNTHKPPERSGFTAFFG